MGRVKDLKWVLVEAGSNQDYIFRTNRRRYAVGASHLLKQVGAWAEDAVNEARKPGSVVETVVATSSKALVLVDDAEVGRRIVETVTRRAAVEAPGMDLWGYVERSAEGSLMERLGLVHAEHARIRYRRAHPAQRAPMAPFLASCVFTGLPAAKRQDSLGDIGVLVSQQTSVIASAANAGIDGIRELVGEAAPNDLKKGTRNAGWLAMIHADGNGIGDLVTRCTTVEELKAFSQGLEQATSSALRGAVERVADECDSSGAGEHIKEWLLPIIVGGDDITVECDARYAVAFTRAYLTEFERATAALPEVADLARAVLGRDHLTASAGIAFVKPKFPFVAAYELASALTHSAKTVKACAPHRSSYDLFVLHDSVLRDLADLRPPIEIVQHGHRVSLSGEVLLAPPGAESIAAPDQVTWVAAHEDQAVLDAVDHILSSDQRGLSASEVRRLQAALRLGGEHLEAVAARLRARAVNAGDNPLLLDDPKSPTLSRWSVVLDMIDMARGTATGAPAASAAAVHDARGAAQ